MSIGGSAALLFSEEDLAFDLAAGFREVFFGDVAVSSCNWDAVFLLLSSVAPCFTVFLVALFTAGFLAEAVLELAFFSVAFSDEVLVRAAVFGTALLTSSVFAEEAVFLRVGVLDVDPALVSLDCSGTEHLS